MRAEGKDYSLIAKENTVTDNDKVRKVRRAYERLVEQLGRVIVGQEEVVEGLVVALLARGHVILEGVPGLAKTLMIRSLADVLDLSFKRIQFTPDLMPSDITGTEILQEDPATGERVFKFVKGPVFANIVLADEVNRTPPKTHAALLEAMQEYAVTAAGVRYELEEPFFVLATQNPIEQEGTYPLPEAQLDRFMFKLKIDYPSLAEEVEIARTTTGAVDVHLEKVLSREEILEVQRLVREVPVAESVARYAVEIVRATRPSDSLAPPFVQRMVSWGAGPRASQNLLLAAKARAVLDGRHAASVADIAAMALPVLRHRIVTNFNAEAEGVEQDEIVRRILDRVAQPSA